jgi:tellurite resistance-related uncharacterized protein
MSALDPAARMPPGLTQYKSTPLFDARTTPPALQGEHSTKSVWGQIQVRSGRLRYVVTDPARTASSIDLAPGDPRGIIEPTILHRVELIGEVEFQVDFWK